MTIQDIARVCHEVNRAYCAAIGDQSQVAWEDAPEWQRESAVAGVRKALEGQTAEQLHQSWCDQKVADGWVFGEEKDGVLKTHPCLRPYADLPEHQKVKDHLFAAVVTGLGHPDLVKGN